MMIYEVLPKYRESNNAWRNRRKHGLLKKTATKKREGEAKSFWVPWAFLLQRVFGVEGWNCPHCSGQMELRAVACRPPGTLKIIRGLGRSARGPPSSFGFF